MLYQILVHTPTWVWALLIGLLWLGLAQSTPRRVSLRRTIALPLAMTGLSLHGTFSAFAADYWSWALWIGAASCTTAWFASSDLPTGVHYDRVEQRIDLPGSWAPLALMMAIFLIRYGVAVLLAMEPALKHDVAAMALVASVYGALSGVFVGRMLRLLRATRPGAATQPPCTSAGWG